MEGDRSFSKFERWLEEEHSSVYEEEFLHRSDLPIGALFAFFGFYPWILSNLALGPLQIIGLATSFLGIMILLRAYVLYRSQLRQYSYRGLSRKTITDAIMFIDSKNVQPEELESPAPYHEKSIDSGYIIGMKEKKFSNFVKSTAGLIVWPSEFINEIKRDLEKKKKRLRFCSISLLVLLLLLMLITYNIFNSGGTILIWIVFIPLVLCTLQSIYYYFQYVFDNSHLLKNNWISDMILSESIQLEETMIEILSRLQAEFQFPLRFHLGHEYPHLVYTGRTKTTYTLVRLKEAVLYPQDTPSKEEATGAT